IVPFIPPIGFLLVSVLFSISATPPNKFSYFIVYQLIFYILTDAIRFVHRIISCKKINNILIAYKTEDINGQEGIWQPAQAGQEGPRTDQRETFGALQYQRDLPPAD
ncbi:MAG TPA: hypothetical protein K8V20_00160, partial [Subdoligranulum variabile]|nr:hypothetical protein [Subdoligranulum variabile]